MCYESHTNRRFHHTALPAVLNVCEIVIEGHSIAHHTRSFLWSTLQNLSEVATNSQLYTGYEDNHLDEDHFRNFGRMK